MSVALDANATAPTTAPLVTTISNGNLTVGSGSNRALIVQLILSGVTTGVSVVWDQAGANQALTLIQATSDAAARSVQLWGLVAPVSGNKIIKASWTNVVNAILNGTSFTGVNQTGGATSFAHAATNTGTGTSASLSVTSATGNMATDAICTGSTLSAPLQTLLFTATYGGTNGGGSYASGAATVNFGWNIGAWAEIGCDIVAAFDPTVDAAAAAAEILSTGVIGTNWGRS